MDTPNPPSSSSPAPPEAHNASSPQAPPQSSPTPPPSPKTMPPAQRRLLVLLLLTGYSLIHLWLGSTLIQQTNHSDRHILSADQKHNLKLTLQTRPDLSPDFTHSISEPLKKWLPHRTDGVVNPLWPWLAAWLADPHHEISAADQVTEQDRQLFNRGRWLNLILTGSFLILIGLALSRTHSLIATLNTLLLIGLGALIPRSVYYQPEPLYFILFTLTWIACLFALLRNSLWIYALIGLLSGLAYLAKGSIHPLLIIFIAVSSTRWLYGWIAAHWHKKQHTTQWTYRNHLFGLGLLLFVHLMTTGPRLSYSIERFGSAFHSYPGYWMWFDDFEPAFNWMVQHNNRKKLTALTPDQRPSFANYRSTHSPQQMIERLQHGVQTKLKDLLSPPVTRQTTQNPKPWKTLLQHRGWYLGGLSLLLLALVTCNCTRRSTRLQQNALHPEALTLFAFVSGTFLAYTLAYGWYTPIGRGDRFMLSLFPALVLTLIWASDSALRRACRRNQSRNLTRLYIAAHLTLLGSLLHRLYQIWQNPTFTS